MEMQQTGVNGVTRQWFDSGGVREASLARGSLEVDVHSFLGGVGLLKIPIGNEGVA
jgi:hypothetical protein